MSELGEIEVHVVPPDFDADLPDALACSVNLCHPDHLNALLEDFPGRFPLIVRLARSADDPEAISLAEPRSSSPRDE